jgi:hypothetical protein
MEIGIVRYKNRVVITRISCIPAGTGFIRRKGSVLCGIFSPFWSAINLIVFVVINSNVGRGRHDDRKETVGATLANDNIIFDVNRGTTAGVDNVNTKSGTGRVDDSVVVELWIDRVV